MGILSDTEEADIVRRIATEVEGAVVWAETSPYPDPKDVEHGVYSE
jgi:TPP-dependent pyruvate/acetoin dehydrogenase alpha subunit